jgi:FAD-linked sulfhydryl oxidase
MTPTAARSRFVLLALFCIALFSILLLEGHRKPPGFPSPIAQAKTGGSGGPQSGAVLTGHAIAPKLGNATAKYVLQAHCVPHDHTGRETWLIILAFRRAELGRAAWKVLHTTFGRFPEKPTEEEKEALRSYVHLFQRLYPWYATRRTASLHLESGG